MYKIKNKDGTTICYAGNIVKPVEVTLSKDYKPGEKGNPTLEEFDAALRRELSDFLEPNCSIVFRPHQGTRR